jgi:hypothetical protein
MLALTFSANSRLIFNHFDPTVLLLQVGELSVRTVWRHNTAYRVMESMLRHLNARAVDPSILGLARPVLRQLCAGRIGKRSDGQG